MINRERLAEMREFTYWSAAGLEMLDTIDKLLTVKEAAERLCDLNPGHMRDSELAQALAAVKEYK